MSDFSEDRPVDTSVDPDIKPPERPGATQRVQDRQVVGELLEEAEPEEAPEEIKLTPEEKRNFERAVSTGRRYDTITVADHKVSIRTLKSGDELRVGLYTKKYLDTQAFARAYQVAVCAAGIVEIVNAKGQEEPLWSSLREIKDADEIHLRNCEALEDFHPVMVDRIYKGIRALEKEDAELGTKLGKY